MLIYAAEYCPCKYESEFTVISLHISKQNAQRIIFRTKNDLFNEQREDRFLSGYPDKGSKYIQDWQLFRIRPMRIFE